MVQPVLTGRSTRSDFGLAWFSSLYSEHLCIFMVLLILNFYYALNFTF